MSDQRADRSHEEGLKPERVQKQPATGRREAERVPSGATAGSGEPAAVAEAETETPAG